AAGGRSVGGNSRARPSFSAGAGGGGAAVGGGGASTVFCALPLAGVSTKGAPRTTTTAKTDAFRFQRGKSPPRAPSDRLREGVGRSGGVARSAAADGGWIGAYGGFSGGRAARRVAEVRLGLSGVSRGRKGSVPFRGASAGVASAEDGIGGCSGSGGG